MNTDILKKYGLVMKKTSEKFYGDVSGSPILSAYIFFYRHPEDVQDFISDIELAINGEFNQIEDSDKSVIDFGGNTIFAYITPTHFKISTDGQLHNIPLEDWKEILLSWKECLDGN